MGLGTDERQRNMSIREGVLPDTYASMVDAAAKTGPGLFAPGRLRVDAKRVIEGVVPRFVHTLKQLREKRRLAGRQEF